MQPSLRACKQHKMKRLRAYGTGLAPTTDDSAKQLKDNIMTTINEMMNGTVIETDEEFNQFFSRIAVREAAFNAVWDGIIEEKDDAEIVQYLSVTMTYHNNDIAFYNALISELYTGSIRSRKEGEPQPTRDLRGFEFVLFQA